MNPPSGEVLRAPCARRAGRRANRTPVHSTAAVAVLLAMGSLLPTTQAASAQELPASVESATDGTGWFTYTFGRGNTPYVWGLDPQTGAIVIHAEAVVSVEDPPGWHHRLSGIDTIEWYPFDQIQFLDEAPVVFRLRSCLTDSISYRASGPGYILGRVFALPERTLPLGGGYQSFDYIGPAAPRLSIELKEGKMIVSWSASTRSTVLETRSEAAGAGDWTVVPEATANPGRVFVAFEPSDTRRFFRLVTTCDEPQPAPTPPR